MVFSHRPVMLDEVLAALCIRPTGWYVDATFGRGGHAGEILARLGPHGRLMCFDKDPEAIAAARERFGDDPRFSVERGTFTMLEPYLEKHAALHRADGVLLDLGVSSPQLDDPTRGFSFRHEGPLDMRMDPQQGESVAAWLARAQEEDIAQVLYRYGEERHGRRIARAIVRARVLTPITTTRQLAEVVQSAVPTREPGKDPATRTFQALRIFINRELEELAACLPQTLQALASGGRLAVISFHSLEDRLVKRFIRDQERGVDLLPNLPVPPPGWSPQLRAVGKAQRPSASELAANPRARSAVLRVAQRV